MGLFDKKICDICGEKIGLLGNRKLADGNLCKDCAKKLSPWFEERRHSTVEDIKRQLEYREKNKKAVMDFCITRHSLMNVLHNRRYHKAFQNDWQEHYLQHQDDHYHHLQHCTSHHSH